MAKNIANETGEKNLCLAGGVALNCVANGILLQEKIFKDIWIQPAAGDAGGALGAAFVAWHLHHSKSRKKSENKDLMQGAYLGPEFSDAEIYQTLSKCGAKFRKLNQESLADEVVKALIDEKAIGWMQGRMEFGPRALGSRSIIADPRSKLMQNQLNMKVKYRESFRPFAPSVLREFVSQWFNLDEDSPYMLLVSHVKESIRRDMNLKEKALFVAECKFPKEFPAIVHIDNTSRVQTVNQLQHPDLYQLLSRFKEETGCPMLVNTSFNVRGEPIVNSPEDAFKCFMGTELDYLVIGNCILDKLK